MLGRRINAEHNSQVSTIREETSILPFLRFGDHWKDNFKHNTGGAKTIPKIILSQIKLGLKIVSHLIHECHGKINSAFKQSWDKEWFQLQAGISL